MILDSPTKYNLVEFLNFAVENEDMPDDRRMKQERFLREFVGSFKGFQSGKGLGQKNPGYMDAELLDKAYFISMGLAHQGRIQGGVIDPPSRIISRKSKE